jgi:hypothetical protein
MSTVWAVMLRASLAMTVSLLMPELTRGQAHLRLAVSPQQTGTERAPRQRRGQKKENGLAPCES